MKTALCLAVVLAPLTGIPLMAQPADAHAQQSATGTQAKAGFGDAAQSHAWEMSSINGELQGKLDAKTAKVGDQVVLKTTEKVQTPDGTFIPRGSRLVGRITQVQAHDSDHGFSQLAIAFDRVELKNSQSIAVHTLIRGVRPGASAMNMNSASDNDSFGAPMGGGTAGNGMGGGIAGGMASGIGSGTGASRSGYGGGGMTGAAGRTDGGLTDAAGDPLGGPDGMPGAGAGAGAATDAKVQTAGHGDLGMEDGAHAAAAARAVPHPTGIPGVMLAGSSSASGVFTAARADVRLDSGTQMQLGIVADE